MPSAEFREQLRKTFGIKKPVKLKNPIPLPLHDKPAEPKKTVGNPLLSYEAQKIYNPQLPPSPMPGPVKPPTQTQANRGTVGAMDTTGPWGQPETKR